MGRADEVPPEPSPLFNIVVNMNLGAVSCAQWLGWIKDYDGGTLMECRLSGPIPYTAVPAMLHAQVGRHAPCRCTSHV